MVLLNKIDLLPHVGSDLITFTGYLRRVDPAACTLQICATRGDGLAD